MKYVLIGTSVAVGVIVAAVAIVAVFLLMRPACTYDPSVGAWEDHATGRIYCVPDSLCVTMQEVGEAIGADLEPMGTRPLPDRCRELPKEEQVLG